MQTRWLALPALAIAAYGAGLLYETLVAPFCPVTPVIRAVLPFGAPT